jgi:diadenosine tetraphosphatase ApaH/serine/threonine PP2A family protein phosphatase
MEIKRTIIVGDIHGCIDEFEELIRVIQYNKNSDRLILLGDLIDRGPDSLAVVQKARKMGLECVMGNHEYKFLKWWKSTGSQADVYDRKDFYTQFTDEDVNYIFRMPTYIKLEGAVIVHAGVKPGIPISAQSKDDLMYLRYTDSEKRFISLKKVAKIGKEAAGAHFWTEFWYGPESVVYGHNVHSMTDPLIEEVLPGVTCYGLDTGCCFGGKLTALVWETKEIVQVQAKRTYYQSKFTI